MRKPSSVHATLRVALVVVVGAASLHCNGGDGGDGGPRKGGKRDKSDAHAEEGPGPERRVLVETTTVSAGEVSDYLVTSGVIEGEFQVDLLPEATGIVSRIMVEEGDVVRPGQTLAVVSSPSLDAGADRANVEVSKARRTLEEATRLHASGAISDKDLQDAKDAMTVATTTQSEATRTRGFTRIDTPIAGTVTVREIRVGELASSARRAFQVVDLDRLRVVVQLPERDLPRVREGQSATLTGAYDETIQVRGHVERIAPVVDAATGTIKVTIAVEPGQTSIRPGQYVKVLVEVDRHHDVLTIPKRALVWDDGEPVAWKVVEAEAPVIEDEETKDAEEPGFFAKLFATSGESSASDDEPKVDRWEGIPRRGVEKIRLTVGYTDTTNVEVTEGLVAGDLVVVVGNGGLRAETLVKLQDDPEPPKKEESKDKPASDGDKG